MVRQVSKLALDSDVQLCGPFHLSPSDVEGDIQCALSSCPLYRATKKDVSFIVTRAKSCSKGDVVVVVSLTQVGGDSDGRLKSDFA